MFKLLLVDDEPIIVEGLFDLFSDYKAGSLDVYKAYSAQEALEWLNTKRIDIVITDIKMPEMDGLQLLERIRANWPECRVIFLTGHDEFDYIYQAIQYSGVSYLLKTESYESIVELVERYLAEITSSYRNDALMQKATVQMQKALPLLQKEFLSDLVEGMETNLSDQRLLDELEIPLNVAQPVLLLVGCIVHSEEKNSLPDKSSLYLVNTTVEQCFSAYASLAGMIYRKNYIMWFMQPKQKSIDIRPEADRDFALYFRNMLESVQAICRESFHVMVSFAIGGDSVAWSEIFENSVALTSMLNGSMRQGMEVIVTNNQPRESIIDEALDQKHISVQLKKLDILATTMEQGKRADFFNVFYELREFAIGLSPNGGLDLEAYYAISLLFISYINRHSLKGMLPSRYNGDRMWGSDTYATMEEAFSTFEQIAHSIFNAQTVETEKRSMASIQKVQDYVLKNLGENLSLNSLADMVYFNPKYLSRLFKQETGYNLSDYINDKKLAKAKELLKQSHIKVHEIAKAVGYSSGPYFTKFFKKSASMTPQEYRDSVIK